MDIWALISSVNLDLLMEWKELMVVNWPNLVAIPVPAKDHPVIPDLTALVIRQVVMREIILLIICCPICHSCSRTFQRSCVIKSTLLWKYQHVLVFVDPWCFCLTISKGHHDSISQLHTAECAGAWVAAVMGTPTDTLLTEVPGLWRGCLKEDSGGVKTSSVSSWIC